jgi:PAS domain S-box-containing protein
MYRLYGIPEGTFGGAYDAWTSTIHPQDKAYTEGEIQAALRGEREYAPEFRIIRPDGVIRYLKADSQTFHDENGKPLRMIGTNIDITERKRMEEALAVSEQEFRSLAESSPDFIIRYDLKHRMRYLNRALVRFLGLATADEVIGKQPINVWPDGRFAIIDEVAARVIKTGNTDTVESMMPAETGEYRFHQIRVVAERDVAGQIIGTIALGRDITERRGMEEEIRKLNLELEQRVAERTEQLQAANKELEAFSYSVSHDLRAPLRAIDGFSHILLEDYAGRLDEEGKHLLNVVRDNTGRMGQLIDDMLQFSRTGRIEIISSDIDMEKLVREVFEELQAMVQVGTKLQFQIEHIPVIRGDRAMMRQVFVNLLSNAIKFSRIREIPMIGVGAFIERDEVVYYVKDNGAGFDMKFADKLFGVFQRLHSVNEFEGTGIGLAIVKRIISRHGGRVWAEGKVGEGAIVYFALPKKELSHE